MNQEIKDKWIAALRSGEYIQGKEALRRKDNTFCCIGVLCDIYQKEKGGEWEDIGDYKYYGFKDAVGNERSGVMTKDVISWTGGTLNKMLALETRLIGLNDGGSTFKEIAKEIETYI